MWFGRCARSWCDDDGVVRVDFDGRARRVWIDDAGAGRMAPALVLCRRHATALTPPLNWELHDLRPSSDAGAPDGGGRARAGGGRDPEPAPEPLPAAGTALVGAGSVRAAAAPAVRRASGSATAVARHGGAAAAVAPAPPGADRAPDRLDETRLDARGWLPRFDRCDDLGGVLDARSPLLARAFASVHDRA